MGAIKQPEPVNHRSSICAHHLDDGRLQGCFLLFRKICPFGGIRTDVAVLPRE